MDNLTDTELRIAALALAADIVAGAGNAADPAVQEYARRLSTATPDELRELLRNPPVK